MHYIFIQQDFPQSLEKVFADLSNHEVFGRIIGANIQRIKDAPGDNPNGLGSVRQINVSSIFNFEETITKFNENVEIEYTVSKGGPIKEHLGCLTFEPSESGCKLEYCIKFEPKWAIPLWGRILKQVIQHPIRKGLAHYASATA